LPIWATSDLKVIFSWEIKPIGNVYVHIFRSVCFPDRREFTVADPLMVIDGPHDMMIIGWRLHATTSCAEN
jgi:hypothetical protein